MPARSPLGGQRCAAGRVPLEPSLEMTLGGDEIGFRSVRAPRREDEIVAVVVRVFRKRDEIIDVLVFDCSSRPRLLPRTLSGGSASEPALCNRSGREVTA